ncbi:hypothetical protein KUTeg_005207 [Tegillarca granosa]|uniref:HECT-type E3 ubiquitin transferase n=1 Tax=Tegillarca granosa TaxID=220873 RepID=A0ABQ9FJ34_TEGGR|nr:hypothetical protein KUTeg_005207 [Tegillarca granosa]
MEMAAESNKDLTCPNCNFTVQQQVGTRRTICPKCGHFYSTEAALRPPQPRRLSREQQQLPNLKDRENLKNREDKDKSGGRLQSIANFFQNLGPNRKSKGNSPSSSSTNQGAAITEQSETSSEKTELPPINSNSSLTTGSKSPAPYQLNPGSRSVNNGDRSARHTPTNGSSRLSPNPTQNKLVYPVRTKTADQLREDVQLARSSGSWKTVHDFYSTTFDSFLEINAAFKRDPNKDYKSLDDPGVKFDFVNLVYELLPSIPQEIQKVVLKSVINSLLKDKRPHTKDDLRAYLILIQNPLFESSVTYTNSSFNRPLTTIFLIKKTVFSQIVGRLQNFIALRLFPSKPHDLPPMSKCSWWIPSATKVMALLNAANNMCNPNIVPFIEFYNESLDHLDLMAEYYTWQLPSSHDGFSFCQYPFILSISAKRSILQRDSEQQMIINARNREIPNVGMLFFNLNVRRSHLVSDSLNEIARKQKDLKKKLKVTFEGEPGLDMGGLTKEWFLLLVRQIFQPDYGMFNYDKKAGVHWFSSAPCESYQEFNLLMGLAVYNSIILDIHFPPCCYKKLLSPAVVPYNNPRAIVGVIPATVDDLKLIQPDVARGLEELLSYDGDVEDDFGLTFQISQTEFGSVKLYCEWVLNKSIYAQFQAFYHGFHSVCASNALIMLRPSEIEMLVCGNPKLDLADLKKVTTYDGYNPQDSAIKNFWDIVLSMPLNLQKRFLLFTTGSDRVPIGGIKEMQFKITRVTNVSYMF